MYYLIWQFYYLTPENMLEYNFWETHSIDVHFKAG